MILTIQSGIPVARIELLDALQMKASNAYSGLTFPEAPTLFVEFHGNAESVALQSKQFAEIAAEFGSSEFLWTANTDERNALWKARHNAYWAQKSLRAGCWRSCPPMSACRSRGLPIASRRRMRTLSRTG